MTEVIALSAATDRCLTGDIPPGVYCGDCWHGKVSNDVCLTLFGLLIVIFTTTVVLMYCYHSKRVQINHGYFSNSYYIMFVFLIGWVVTRIAYFSDALNNYSFKTLAALGTLPTLFTFITISVALFNV